MGKPEKPFGTLMRTENAQLAEIFIREVGYDYEFDRAEFLKKTGIKEMSIGNLLLKLIEIGVITAYPHPRYQGRQLYRVAWPVLIKRPARVSKPLERVGSKTETPVEIVNIKDVQVPTEDYTVTLVNPVTMESWILEKVQGVNPRDAAYQARQSLKATVTKSWEM